MFCTEKHYNRLLVGEASFTYACSLLRKHEIDHTDLGQSIIATDLNTGRTLEECAACFRLFLEQGEELAPNFCSERCQNIDWLIKSGVTVILGFDATKMHESEDPNIKGRTFDRIHWNCPHDGSPHDAQTLATLVFNFFKSSSKMQNDGDRIHITLAQPNGCHFYDQGDKEDLEHVSSMSSMKKKEYYQGYVYNIENAAESHNYHLYAIRPFGSERYPGYGHETVEGSPPSKAAETLREFVFIKGENQIPLNRKSSSAKSAPFYNGEGHSWRHYYTRDTDNESSDYSMDEED